MLLLNFVCSQLSTNNSISDSVPLILFFALRIETSEISMPVIFLGLNFITFSNDEPIPQPKSKTSALIALSSKNLKKSFQIDLLVEIAIHYENLFLFDFDLLNSFQIFRVFIYSMIYAFSKIIITSIESKKSRQP